jgi:hypothetical protein
MERSRVEYRQACAQDSRGHSLNGTESTEANSDAPAKIPKKTLYITFVHIGLNFFLTFSLLQ